MNRIYLEKHEPNKNMHRFYALQITQTIFGEWALIREWGRVGSTGAIKEIWFKTKEEAITSELEIVSQKEKKGYINLTPL